MSDMEKHLATGRSGMFAVAPDESYVGEPDFWRPDGEARSSASDGLR